MYVYIGIILNGGKIIIKKRKIKEKREKPKKGLVTNKEKEIVTLGI